MIRQLHFPHQVEMLPLLFSPLDYLSIIPHAVLICRAELSPPQHIKSNSIHRLKAAILDFHKQQRKARQDGDFRHVMVRKIRPNTLKCGLK